MSNLTFENVSFVVRTGEYSVDFSIASAQFAITLVTFAIEGH